MQSLELKNHERTQKTKRKLVARSLEVDVLRGKPAFCAPSEFILKYLTQGVLSFLTDVKKVFVSSTGTWNLSGCGEGKRYSGMLSIHQVVVPEMCKKKKGVKMWCRHLFIKEMFVPHLRRAWLIRKYKSKPTNS